MEGTEYVIARYLNGYETAYLEDFHGTIEEAISYILSFNYGNKIGLVYEAHICDTSGNIIYRNKLAHGEENINQQ